MHTNTVNKHLENKLKKLVCVMTQEHFTLTHILQRIINSFSTTSYDFLFTIREQKVIISI